MLSAVIAAVALAAVSGEEQPRVREPVPPPADRRLSGEVGVQWVNAYYFRGLRQEDDGLIVQPSAELAFELFSRDEITLGLVGGAWASVHGDDDTARTDSDWLEHWYEQDVYVGLGLGTPAGDIGLTYTWYMSPSDAFETLEELTLTYTPPEPFETPLGLYAQLGIETDADAADGQHSGVYLEIGAEPALPPFSLGRGELTISFPVRVGLSLDDYYEHADDGDDDVFGYVAAGAAATLARPTPGGRGSWSVRVGVEWLHLGESASSYNGDDEDEFIAYTSVVFSF